MKIRTAVLSLLLFSTAAAAQNPDPSKWTCRNLSDSGGFVNTDETIFGNLACRPVAQTPAAPAQPTPAAASDSDTPATIYFYRAKRFQGSALKPSVFIDDAPVGNLHNGDSLRFSLKPGKHRVYSTDKSTGIDLEVKPGETYYVRVDILVGFWKGHVGVTLVDPQQGKYELGQVTH